MLRVATVAAFVVATCLPSHSVLGFSVPPVLPRGHTSNLGFRSSTVNVATRSHRAPALRMVASNEDLQVGVSDDVQNVGRGTLLAKDGDAVSLWRMCLLLFRFSNLPSRMLCSQQGSGMNLEHLCICGDPCGDVQVKEVTGKVQGLYDAYPYPPEKVFDGPTVGYNHRFSLHPSMHALNNPTKERIFDGAAHSHRWSWTHAYSSIFGEAPQTNAIEILDAGCGTGVRNLTSSSRLTHPTSRR